MKGSIVMHSRMAGLARAATCSAYDETPRKVSALWWVVPTFGFWLFLIWLAL